MRSSGKDSRSRLGWAREDHAFLPMPAGSTELQGLSAGLLKVDLAKNAAISTERAPMAGATTGSTRPRSAGARRRLSLRETRTGKPSARRMSSATTQACGRAWHRFTRLTNAFSRKIQNHVHMVAPVRLPVQPHAHSPVVSRNPGQGSRAGRQGLGHGGVYPDHGRSRAETETAQTIRETESER